MRLCGFYYKKNRYRNQKRVFRRPFVILYNAIAFTYLYMVRLIILLVTTDAIEALLLCTGPNCPGGKAWQSPFKRKPHDRLYTVHQIYRE